MNHKRWTTLLVCFGALLASLYLANVAHAQTGGTSGPFFSNLGAPKVFTGDVRSLPLADLSQPQLPRLRHTAPPIPSNLPTLPLSHEPVEQQASTSLAMPSPSVTFEGRPNAGDPPDTNGDVGPNHYIQTVNSSFSIYNKTGTLLAGPTNFTALFGAAPATGTPCDNQFTGDPIVLYDVMADRWVLTSLGFVRVGNDWTSALYECIAVSRTPDPVSGGWYKYAFMADSGALLNDYPKLSVWPDAYYMTANMYNKTTGFDHVRVWALERAALLAGSAPREVHFELPSNYFSLLPSNVRGILPPAGSPNFLMSSNWYTSTQLHLWRFHVDFNTPGNSWLGTSSVNSNPVDLTVATYNVPSFAASQPGTTGTLDTLADRLMYALQYRNNGGSESLWANHTVNSGGVLSIRWYEIRNPNGAVSVNQQQTFTNGGDGIHRWMGALAVDRFGNMAVGYSVSNSSSIYPGIRYAGRLAGDPTNTLWQGEATMIAGTGYHSWCSGCGNRWGDYTSMTIDPVDGCTFWYTNQYGVVAGGGNYNTRIGSFRFPGCGGNFVVDRSDDLDVSDCTSAANDCTLRGAINKINGGGFVTTITFDPSVTKINLTSSLPTITASHNGIQGVGGSPRIDGAATGAGTVAVGINADEVKLSGVSIVNLDSGSPSSYDVRVYGGTGTSIFNNNLGTMPAGPSIANCTPAGAPGGAITRNARFGILADTNANSLYVYSNVVGCHSVSGIYLWGADNAHIGEDSTGASHGNLIGKNASNVALGNTNSGIALVANGSNGAKSNLIRDNVIANTSFDGIELYGTGTNNTSSTSGNVIRGNTIYQNGSDGILFWDGAFWNEIGGDQDADRNLIYGNGGNGVRLYNSSGNGILGNYIGSVAGGGTNAGNGILIDGGDSNSVGRMFVIFFMLERGNVIGGNNGDGVQIINNSNANSLAFNYIGTNVAGSAAVPNGLSGVAIFNGAYNNTVGLNSKANLIAGNAGYGVYIAGSTTATNTVAYNDIGVNSTLPAIPSGVVTPRLSVPTGGGGGLAIPNGADGLTLQGGTFNNVITDTNWIAKNSASGVYITGGAHDNTFFGDSIFSNGFYGVILDGSGTNDNVFQNAYIYANGYDGIGERNNATDNRWSKIATFDNGGLGIDKSASSDFTNVPTLPFPRITSVVKSGSNVIVSGTSNSTYANAFGSNLGIVELYQVGVDPSGYGEGKTYLGSDTTDGSGNWQITVPSTTVGCYTAFETNTGSNIFPSFWNYSSEFGPNSCRLFLPLITK